ncbi:glycosyltransferase family 29 protein [Candidatus Pelagibacter sp.]|nr:glycosyltransferase family 29 protein [Candidatus Pelagibacter sp.]
MKEEFIHSKFLHNMDNIILVGSSSDLLTERRGKSIDDYKYVVRFNKAPVKNFEDYVGTRTSLRILNHHVFNNTERSMVYDEKFHLSCNDNILTHHQYQNDYSCRFSNHNFYMSYGKIFEKLIIYEFSNIYKLKNLIHNYININKSNFSLGLFYIFLFIIFKKKISIIGFNKKNKHNERKHYYSDLIKPGIYHDLKIESEIINILKFNKFIEIIY